jgi:hypothetical protein
MGTHDRHKRDERQNLEVLAGIHKRMAALVVAMEHLYCSGAHGQRHGGALDETEPAICRHPLVIGMSAIDRWDRLVRGRDSGPKESMRRQFVSSAQ